MTARKAAPLSASLLARKGDARPADAPAEPRGTAPQPLVAPGPVVPPVSGVVAPSAAAAGTIPAPVKSVSAQPAPRTDVHDYGWPTTQGAPPSDVDLMMPPPPPETAAPPPAGRAHRGRIRRWAMFGLAAAVTLTAGGLLLKDRPAPSRDVIAEIAPPATAIAPPATLDRDAHALQQIAPAAGTPGPAAARPPAAVAPPPHAVASLPPPGDDPLPPVDSATLVPPTLEPAPARPVETKTAPPKAAPTSAARSAPSRPAPAATRPPATAAAAGPGVFALQLASIGSKSRAQAESVRLAKSLAPVLGSRKPVVEEGVVSGRGTVYRIRIAGFASRPAAERACQQIKGRGQDCLVIKR